MEPETKKVENLSEETEKYETPEIEVIEFETRDILTDSSGDEESQW